MNRVPLGVVIKTWNTPDATRLCLDSIAAADRLPEEIAVLDLGDDAETRQHAEALATAHGVALHWEPIGRRIAPGVANRHALELLSAPLICLLDSDVVVPRNWLGPTIRLLADASIGLIAPIRPDPFLPYPVMGGPAAGGRIILTENGNPISTEAALDALTTAGRPLPEVVDAFTDGVALDQFGRAARDAAGLEPLSEVAFPSFFSSCCLFFDRGVVEDAGGVADALFDAHYGSEDVDLSWRVLNAGYALVRTAEVFVLHFRHTSLNANRVDFAAELVAANRRLYGRWREHLLSWAADRIRSGDTIEELSWRFIVRELRRNTSFEQDLRDYLKRRS